MSYNSKERLISAVKFWSTKGALANTILTRTQKALVEYVTQFGDAEWVDKQLEFDQCEVIWSNIGKPGLKQLSLQAGVFPIYGFIKLVFKSFVYDDGRVSIAARFEIPTPMLLGSMVRSDLDGDKFILHGLGKEISLQYSDISSNAVRGSVYPLPLSSFFPVQDSELPDWKDVFQYLEQPEAFIPLMKKTLSVVNDKDGNKVFDVSYEVDKENGSFMIKLS
ncbi:TPA: hypothetical protein ACWLXL_004424 [Pseudomonas aeruginosa]